MNRAQAIVVIRADVAENGQATKFALRAYVENRVSYASFQQACREGMAIYARRTPAVLEVERG